MKRKQTINPQRLGTNLGRGQHDHLFASPELRPQAFRPAGLNLRRLNFYGHFHRGRLIKEIRRQRKMREYLERAERAKAQFAVAPPPPVTP